VEQYIKHKKPHVYNASLSSGIFPYILQKTMKVIIPLYKKRDIHDGKNYFVIE
jgi:hypothetical protein